MEGSEHDIFMRRCLELSVAAEGMTYPNPMVGSVIVHNGNIIGEGFHKKAGLPHAEVNAINAVVQKEQLKDSTLYVNLEPCSHHGKTPPCADFIITNKIPRVVVGAVDTSSKVSGEGIRRLREAGVEVLTGILEDKSRWVNRRFFRFNENNRPWIVLKWAKSSDGFLDLERAQGSTPIPYWISGQPERVLVHRWRSYEQAILAGAGTIRADKPRLNVREWAGKSPLVLILSSSGNINPVSIHGSKVVFTHNSGVQIKGAEIVTMNTEEPSSVQIVRYLFEKGLQSLFVEGGSQVLNHFISTAMWDEARIFTGRKNFGKGIASPLLSGTLISSREFEGSLLQTYINESDIVAN
jgi:diaminohydroxyphosphoribosylaminopyrimidine deaminase/5-amino-6-(5-phosphoribosylamino)uracil reductase